MSNVWSTFFFVIFWQKKRECLFKKIIRYPVKCNTKIQVQIQDHVNCHFSKIHCKTILKYIINVNYRINHIHSLLQRYCAAACGHRLVATVMARLVKMIVHRDPRARPCAPGQDSGYDGDQQRCAGGMLSHCPPRDPTARL
jgi:hypothetical protein